MFIPLEGKISHIPALLGLEGNQEKVPHSSAGRFQCFQQSAELWESLVWELSTACVFVVFVQKESLGEKKQIKAGSSQIV